MKLKIGYFEHWHQPPYKFVDFLRAEGIEVEKIDYSQKGYLEKFDIALIEQNGFNDYIENDEPYIQNWVKNGGILVFMHQDYQRWVPQFLPAEVGYTQLIHRHVYTIDGHACGAHESFAEGDDAPYKSYLMPWIEKPGKRLFSEPEVITPDEMLHWKLYTNSFGIIRRPNDEGAMLTRTTAESCFLAPEGWEILGSFMDPAVRDGALILKANYGKGMYFLNQILFPEVETEESERCFAFWKKYVKNLIAYLQRFKKGETEEMPAEEKKTLPLKKNYKLASHMHSLDWYGADSSPGTINAIMRYMGWDICALAVKDTNAFGGKLDLEKYSDDKVLFLHGQEYHPFNWNDKYDHISHNGYHMLAIGIDEDAYTPRFTCSFFSDEEIDAYLKECIEYVHAHGGAICAAHPEVNYWMDYPIDAADREPMRPLSGENMERQWLEGGRVPVMNAVDLYGPRRPLDNPAINFIYLKGEAPCRDSVVKAIRNGHTMAAAGFDEADVTLNGYVPGDVVPKEEAAKGTLSVSATISQDTIRKIRVYSDAELIVSLEENAPSVSVEIPLEGFSLGKFVRVEIEGKNEGWICNSTPFFLE